ncbi:hypothetical protein Poly59_61570 [Rubripirellula reticaptiva]|uniref:Uncharacterized protein n=1 Tax=Rubripirellula reticaptiva TaxID=2528013 RepID=A0A5C6E7E3_9BACT|nr:hypothetical protein Poly59_61570 [Rubripirellula reticaptiva]
MDSTTSQWSASLRFTPYSRDEEATNHGMQRSGGGLLLGEINDNSRRPLIPVVIRLTPSGVRRICSHKRSLQRSNANLSFGFCVSESTRQTF